MEVLLSFQEMLKRLEADLEWYLRSPASARAGRIAAFFDATTAEAAEELAGWWRQQPGITAAVEEQPRATPEELAALAETLGPMNERVLSLRQLAGHPWQVQVSGPDCQAPGFTVKSWLDLLHASPQDARWAFTGTAIADREAQST
jgi:hypothetical protein